MSDEEKWDLICAIGTKFMRKVAAERQARLAGQIVAADFYLRQITMMEVMFDLTANSLGFDPHSMLRKLQCGSIHSREIVSTPFSDWLDRVRRDWWQSEGDPERPPHPDLRFLVTHRTTEGECSTYVDQHATGALTTPARGYTQEEWAEMTHDEQRIARQRQFDQDAEAQVAWEAEAHRDFEARQQGEAMKAQNDL